ncbi:MAG: ComEC/Rec2 family competence protein [Paracoccaceae bacterium]
MATLTTIGQAIAGQRGYLLCWVPVCLALGIGLYFSLPVEPGPKAYGGLGLGILICAVLARNMAENWRPLILACLLIMAGIVLAGVRAHRVAEPVLGFRYYGPIQGRIVNIDRSGSDAVRLTLDQVVLKKMSPGRTPARVRISLHGQQGFVALEPGLVVILTGHLSPPSGPVEPGGFDFQRKAWFEQLGAVGYTRTPVLAFELPEVGGLALRITRIRLAVSGWVQAEMPGKSGAFAAAIMTGDRSGMDQAGLQDLRSSNLAHLLAISGLHMGLLTGFVFTVLRVGLSTVAPLALRWPVKKLAAIGALLVGAAYLALSGGNVATERAYIMVAVMFLAVLMDRRAVTLRAVAVAATIVLVTRPEVLPGPGFQMSFAATTALVAVFGALRHWRGPRGPKWARPLWGVVISSGVAGLATAPFAAAHFNRIADFGLLANLLSVPLMGVVVMPGAVLAACLAPIGLGWVGLAVMQPAIQWILGVAHWVAGLDGALTFVPTPGLAVLPVLTLGALWGVLWRGRLGVRLVGVVPVMLAFTLWFGVERPEILISETGGLVGVLTEDGRVLSKLRGDGFAAKSWLENDGDGAIREAAFERSGFAGVKGALEIDLAGTTLMHLSGRGARDRVAEACDRASFVFITVRVEPDDYGCDVYDPVRLRDTGAIAFAAGEKGLEITTARQRAGDRLWNSRDVRAAFWDGGQSR